VLRRAAKWEGPRRTIMSTNKILPDNLPGSKSFGQAMYNSVVSSQVLLGDH